MPQVASHVIHATSDAAGLSFTLLRLGNALGLCYAPQIGKPCRHHFGICIMRRKWGFLEAGA